jgi:hypothetical protein
MEDPRGTVKNIPRNLWGLRPTPRSAIKLFNLGQAIKTLSWFFCLWSGGVRLDVSKGLSEDKIID